MRGLPLGRGFLPPRTYVKWLQLDQYGPVFIIILMLLLWGPFGLNTLFYDGLRELYRLFLPARYF